jgi:electron transport complex protein RnfG
MVKLEEQKSAKKNKEIVRYGITLLLIFVVAGASLAIINSFTKAKAQSLTEEAIFKEVFPLAVNFEAVTSCEETIYYKAFDKEGKFVGAVFKASGKGFSSTIVTIAGLTKDGKITAIKVINQNETSGMGSRVTESDFSSRFCDKDLKNLNEVQAITGATISSSAVIESVKQKAEEISQLIKNAR